MIFAIPIFTRIKIVPANTNPVTSPEKICKLLNSLKGQFWDQKEVNSIVTDFYAAKGLIPVLNFTNEGDQKNLSILESPLISRVFLAFDKNISTQKDQTEILKIFYNLLPSDAWKIFDYQSSLQTDDLKQRFFEFSEKTYFNLLDFQLQQIRLASLATISQSANAMQITRRFNLFVSILRKRKKRKNTVKRQKKRLPKQIRKELSIPTLLNRTSKINLFPNPTLLKNEILKILCRIRKLEKRLGF